MASPRRYEDLNAEARASEGVGINEDFLLEQQQLTRLDEIRHALRNRDDLIDKLEEKVEAYKLALVKTKAQAGKFTTELVKCEEDNISLRDLLIRKEAELKVTKDSERKLDRMIHKLERELQTLSTSNAQTKSLQHDVKKLQEQEAKLRMESRKLTEWYEKQVEKLAKDHVAEVEILETTKQEQIQRIRALEKTVSDKHEAAIKAELALKEKQLDIVELERKVKEEGRRGNELEKRFESEMSRVETLETRLREETARANDSEQRLHDAEARHHSEVESLRHLAADFEGKCTANDHDRKELDNSWRTKYEQLSKELKRKSALIFELENKLNGTLFVAERKLTQVEREADSRVRTAAKQASESHRLLEEREKAAAAVLWKHASMISRIESLENAQQLLLLQRDWYIETLNCLAPVLQMLPSPANDRGITQSRPVLLEAGKDTSIHRNKVIQTVRKIGWAIVFISKLRHAHERKALEEKMIADMKRTSRENPSDVAKKTRVLMTSASKMMSLPFAWSPSAVLAKSRELVKYRASAFCSQMQAVLEESVQLQVTQTHLTKVEQSLSRRNLSIRDLKAHAAFFESRNEELELQLRKVQERLQTTSENEREKAEQVHSLMERIEHLENERMQCADRFAQGKAEWQRLKDDAERKMQKLMTRLKLQHAELEQERQAREIDLALMHKLECERDDAIAESKNAKEMVQRLEQYAEREIQSLTRMVDADTVVGNAATSSIKYPYLLHNSLSTSGASTQSIEQSRVTSYASSSI